MIMSTPNPASSMAAIAVRDTCFGAQIVYVILKQAWKILAVTKFRVRYISIFCLVENEMVTGK